MANEILAKFGASTAFTITINTLVDGAERQSTIVNNATVRAMAAIIYLKIIMNQSSAADAEAPFNVYLIRHDADTENVGSDASGDSDAAITAKNAQLLGTLTTGPSPATSGVANEMEGEFVAQFLGPRWGIIVENLTGQTLHTTGNIARYLAVTSEVQ